MSTTTETAACWTVRWGPEDDQIAHLPTQEAAEKHRDGFLARPAEIVQLDHPCHTITCAIDGYVFDEGGEGVAHFPSPEEAVRWVLLCDWADSPAGPVCQGCVEDGRYTP